MEALKSIPLWREGHANNKEILRCDSIEKVFGKGNNQVTALNGISLSIEKGDFVAIIGCLFIFWAAWTSRRAAM